MDVRTRNGAAIVVLLLIVLIAIVALKIRISTDISLFLPEPSNKAERLLHHQLNNGASTNLVFIALTGLPPNRLAQTNSQLTGQLQASGVFRKVINRADDLSDKGLDFLVANRYLLSHSDLTQQLSEEGLKSALQQRLQGLSSSQAPLEKKFLRQDPSGEVLALLEEWQGKLSRHARPEILHGMWFSKNHERTLILAEIDATISKLENQVNAVQTIRDSFDNLKAPGLQMIVTGPAAFAVESGEDIKEDVRLLTWMAIFFVTLFLMSVYRSIAMLLLVFAPLLSGILAATAGILLIHGQIHGITLAFGITLAGVAVDYPIHLLTGLTRARQRTTGKDMSYVQKIWPTLRLGVLSTIFAYSAFLMSGFGGLQQLGLFTIIGLATAALFSRWVLPYLLHANVEHRNGLAGVHKVLKLLAGGAAKFRSVVLLSGLAALGVMFFSGLPVLHLNVDSLSPIKDSRRAQGKLLRNDLGYWYGGRMMIVSAESKEAVLQKTEQMAPYLDDLIKQEALSGYDMASQFLPSLKRQQQNLDAFKNIKQVQQNLELALDGMPFKAKVFQPFIDNLEAVRNASPIEVDAFLKRDLGKRLAPLIFDFEEGAAGVVLLHGVRSEDSMRHFADKHFGVEFMHLKTSATELVSRSVSRVSLIMIGCIMAIYLLMTVSFGNPWRPFKIMVPTFSAAVVTAGLLIASGCPLSIFHLISLMLVVGLGLDYALFFNRLPGNADEWNTTFKSLWVCGVTTILVFGILILSQTPPLKAIGMTVGIGASLSMLFAAMWATFQDREVVENSPSSDAKLN